MAEYISREEAISKIERLRDKCDNDEMAFALNWAIGLVEKIPAADVQPVVRGEWEESRVPGISGCSNCHDCYIDTEWAKDGKWNYCPYCGARMEVEHD